MTHELYKNKEEIESWLNQYKIKNYKLIEDEKYGYMVNVNASVNLKNKKIDKIKVKFNVIYGYFDISCNDLKSLYGFPKKISGLFNCSSNQLTSLEYCPEVINGNFLCINNKINSLKGCPLKINGSMECSNNELVTLINSPKIINGTFSCSYNKLNSLEGCPEEIKGNFFCKNNNLKSLDYFPKKINDYCFLSGNHELREIQNIEDFNELKKIHDAIILNKKLEKEISIENKIKSCKIKL